MTQPAKSSAAPRCPYEEVTLYFSTGTGNAFRAASWLAEAARGAGARARVIPQWDADPKLELAPGPTRLVGILGPAHGFTAPWSVIRFVTSLPRGRGTHAFSAFTRGGTKIGPVFLPGWEGTANYLVLALLALKGYRPRGAEGLDFPSNWMSLHSGFQRKPADAMIARQRVKVDSFARALLSGATAFRALIAFALGLLVIPISIGYLLMGKVMLAKMFFASGRCTGCGLCAESCSHQAIVMEGSPRRPFWTTDCESCMRCMAYCPHRAIEAGHSLLALVLVLALWLPTGAVAQQLIARWSPDLAATLGAGHLPALIESAWMVVVSIAVYRLVLWAMRWRFVRAAFTYTTLTHLYRRYHEPKARLGDLVGRDWERASKAVAQENRKRAAAGKP